MASLSRCSTSIPFTVGSESNLSNWGRRSFKPDAVSCITPAIWIPFCLAYAQSRRPVRFAPGGVPCALPVYLLLQAGVAPNPVGGGGLQAATDADAGGCPGLILDSIARGTLCRIPCAARYARAAIFAIWRFPAAGAQALRQPAGFLRLSKYAYPMHGGYIPRATRTQSHSSDWGSLWGQS